MKKLNRAFWHRYDVDIKVTECKAIQENAFKISIKRDRNEYFISFLQINYQLRLPDRFEDSEWEG